LFTESPASGVFGPGALHRNGSKLSQPLASLFGDDEEGEKWAAELFPQSRRSASR
jgi:hypothetical protein